jgi:predicted Zn-dependent protease
MSPSPLQIAQVLLLFDEDSSDDYGLALWAALHEAEAFYNLGEKRLEVRRFYISPHIPAQGFLGSIVKSAINLFSSDDRRSALDLLKQEERVQTKLAGDEAKKPDSKTYDQARLVAGAREKVLRPRLGPSADQMPLMIITDRPITPPENWRYIIWDSWQEPQSNAVISTVPVDPAYWEISDKQRLNTIKDRIRTAIMAISGSFLGLHSCSNPRCFLLEHVDSVLTLDRMKTFGQEHSSEIPQLVGRGFDLKPSDPNVVQQVAGS